MDFMESADASRSDSEALMDEEVERRVRRKVAELYLQRDLFLRQRDALKVALMAFIDAANDTESIVAFEQPLSIACYVLKMLHDGKLGLESSGGGVRVPAE